MQRFITTIRLGLATLLVGVSLGLAATAPAFAQVPSTVASIDSSKQEVCQGAGIGASCAGGGGVNRIVKTAITLLSIVVGIAAVVMVIISGLKYITSGGDTQKVAGAKSALIYAIVGLAIVALAQVIVHFVLGKTS